MSINETNGVVIKDNVDARLAARLAEMPAVKDMAEAKAEEIPELGSLIGDVFAGLFKAAPKLREADECMGVHHLHRKLMEHAMQMDAWHKIRAHSVLKAPVATASAIEFAREFDPPDDVKQSMKDMAEAEQMLQQAIEDSNERAQQEAVQGMEQAAQAFDKAVDGNALDMARAVRAAAGKAAEIGEAVNASGLVLCWGEEAGQETVMSPDAAMMLVEKIRRDPTLAEILRMAGRLRLVANSTLRNRTRKATDTVVDVKLGDNLARLLPMELACLADPDREDDFMRRYTERELVEYEMIGNEPEGKGPIIVCKDESSSMSGGAHVWATAITLALASAAQKDGRDFGVVHFGAASEIKTRLYRKGEKANLMEIATHFFGGGTSFERPLAEALSMIEDSLPRADIIFITDGACYVSDAFVRDWSKMKEALGARLIAFGVNGGNVDALKTIANATASLTCDEEGAVRVINTILS